MADGDLGDLYVEVTAVGIEGLSGTVGASGITGPTGATGATGYVGSRGDLGYTGSQGVGYVGSQGGLGYTGSQGDVGYTGSQGDTGYIGSVGATGFTGATGYTGSVGATGIDGASGATGYTGSVGATGYTGSVGATGYTGATGATGYTGSVGATGYTGSVGATGYTGATGVIGYTGSQGLQGTFGGAAFDYTFDTDTTDSDPTDGYLRLNNILLSSAGFLYIHDNDDLNVSIYNYLQTIDDSTSSIKGHFTITEKTNPNNYAMFAIVGSHTHATNYFKVPVSWLSGATSFTDNLDIIITFARTGDRGDTGYIGSVGATGATGIQGYTGSIGSTGVIGYTGSEGATGATGYIGSVGATGATGIQGYTGSEGATGIQGYTGSIGATGATGIQGYTGSEGATGIQGYTGSIGATGVIGYTGSEGATGIQGYTGSAGYTGSQGNDGYRSGFLYAFNDDIVDTDPGYVQFKFNSSSTGSITFMNISKLPLGFTDATGWLNGLDDSSSSVKGQLILNYAQGINSLIVLDVVGSVTEYSTYFKVPVSWVSGVVPNASETISFNFSPTGDKGEIGATGVTGIQGYTGSIGSTGVIGYTGSEGATGSTGLPGIYAASSPPVDTTILWLDESDPDATGLLDGATGPIGASGPAGAQGASGSSYTESVYVITGTTPALSPDNGTIQTWVLTGVSTPTQGTWASGQSFTLMIDDGPYHSVIWNTLGVIWVNGNAPALPTSGYAVIQLWKVASTIYGAYVGDVA